MTSLTFDLTSNQEKLPQKIDKKLSLGIKGKKPRAPEEDPSPGWTEAIDVM